jgi:hypothetical protein
VVELDGVIDLHVHFGPDVRPRKTTLVELARAADDAGMRALLVKNHHTSTVQAAAAATEQGAGIQVFGGLVLNEWVGGLNPCAVEAALQMGARAIWLPTLSAENERAQKGRAGTGISVLCRDGALRPEVREILRLVAERDVILGTGHLSPSEICAVVKAAREAGVKRILVTHPEIHFIQLPVSMQRDLAGPDLFFERCFAREIFTRDWDELARDIREVGVESTVLATDLGQSDTLHPVEGMRRMLAEYTKRDFSRSELQIMSSETPGRLLGLNRDERGR